MFLSRVFTLYPEYFPGYLSKGLFGKSKGKEWDLETVNIRDYALDKHKTVDDTPYGGGNGMIMKADVLTNSLDANIKAKEKTLYLSPRGKVFNSNLARDFSSEKTINMEFSFAMDLDKQRYDDSSLHAYIYLQIYPQSTCWLNSLGSYCDGGQNWVYMECDLESNSVESSETPEPEMDKPNDSSILPWFSTTWTIVLVAFCALIHRKVN